MRQISVEKIVKRIERVVENKIDSIMKEKEKEAEKIRDEIEQDKEKKLKNIKKEKEREIKTLKSRIISQAKLESRKKKLKVREEMIEKIFKMAKEKLKMMDPEEYKEFLKNSIEKAHRTLEGDITIHCPKKSEDDVKEIAKTIDPSLEVAGDLKSTGGIKAISEKGATINLTFEANLERKRKELRKEISDILFSEEE